MSYAKSFAAVLLCALSVALFEIWSTYYWPVTIASANANEAHGTILNIVDFGAKGDGRSDDTKAIQRAESKAEELNGAVVHYPTTPNGYLISKPILVRGSHIVHRGDGQQTIIRQISWGLPVFEVSKSRDVTITSLSLVSTQPRVVIPGLYNGEPARDRSAGVYAFGTSHLSVHHLWVSGFVAGVSISAADATVDSDNTVAKCEFRTVDQGVLAVGQRNLKIEHLVVTTALSQAGNPGHAIYMSAGRQQLEQQRVQVDDIRCVDCAAGTTVQFKHVSDLTANNVVAINSAGLLSIEAVQNSTFRHLISQGGKPIPNTAIIHFIGEVSHNRFEDIKIEGARDTVAIALLGNSEDNIFSHVTISETLSPTAGTPPILVRGARNQFRDLTIKIYGANKPGIVIDKGLGHKVQGYRYLGLGQRGIVVKGSAQVDVR